MTIHWARTALAAYATLIASVADAQIQPGFVSKIEWPQPPTGHLVPPGSNRAVSAGGHL
jgi:hypothetical protein